MSWPLTPQSPLIASPAIGSGNERATVSASSGLYLGRCITRPLRRDQKNDYANSTGIDLVSAAVVQILGTIASTGVTRGELPWRPEFGSAVELLRFKRVDEALEDLADLYVFEAIQRWEPRAIVRQTQMSDVVVDGVAKVVLRVIFDVAATSTPGSEIIAQDLVAEHYLT